MISIQKLEQAIARHKYNEVEIIAEIGRERYLSITTAIKAELEKYGLVNLQAQHLLSHLSDTFRAATKLIN